MLYKQNENELSKKLFENPSSEYRGAPFWAWNCRVTKERIHNSIMELKEMGMGGVHLHSRTGMNIPYLSEEFFNLVKESLSETQKNDMLLWLYDEDRWPSGYGGGFVTSNHKYRRRFLVFSPENIDNIEFSSEFRSSARPCSSLERSLLRCFEVKISSDGWLEEYKVIKEDAKLQEGYQKWYAYMEVSADDPWFNNQAYVDTLNPEAIDYFIHTTHDKYYQYVGENFGTKIPAIFTDEPQFCHKQRMGEALGKETSIIPYTEQLEEYFIANYGKSLLDSLPELFWEFKESISEVRYHYHDAVCELFTNSYAVNIGNWCREHNIMLTGHMMEEPTLMSQTAALGEAMRSYKAFDLPGIDMLCDSRELTTAKQAQSVSHQYGRAGVLSELYGVTNWDFDFRGHKLQGDWQAALGVTVRVHHLNWLSMAGESKRDYPAAIGYQSPWYRKYHYVEDYFARVNTVLTRGKAHVRIGVIHPIESYWLYWGTEEKTSGIREDLEKCFDCITRWLLFNTLDFDFISESLLPEELPDLDSINNGVLPVGEMKYDVVLIPNCITLRKTTVERLERYIEHGGKVIVAGLTPQYIDAKKSKDIITFIKKCDIIPFNQSSIVDSLDSYRTVEILDEKGIRSKNLICQYRKDANCDWLFVAHVYPSKNPDIPVEECYNIKIAGLFAVEEYNAVDGNIVPCKVTYKEYFTIIHKNIYEHDSILLRLEKLQSLPTEIKITSYNHEEMQEVEHLCNKYAYELSEPNVLLLDMAKYSLDDEEWSEREEEILRIDNKVRERLHFPLRMEAIAQPWTDKNDYGYEHRLNLLFTINSKIRVENPCLAVEDVEDVRISLNGKIIDNVINGWFADRDIKTIKLPYITPGENELILSIPYNKVRNIEAIYLLGEFGVQVYGSYAEIIEKPEKLFFGDLATQGYPFYGGNITYIIDTILEEGNYNIQISKFRAPLLTVEVNGKDQQIIAYAPYQASLGCLKKKMNKIKITVYGSRVNTFGTVHNCNEKETWYGPNAWRTKESAWSYEYQLKKIGILKAPVLLSSVF